MREQDRDSDRDASAPDIDRRTLLKGATATGLIGVGTPAMGQLTAAQQQPINLPHRVTLRPVNEGEQVSYRFRVDGEVGETESTGTLGYDTIEHGDGLRDPTFVDGQVGGTVEGNEDPEDAYRFAGNFVITEYDKPIEVTLELNGSTTGSDDGDSEPLESGNELNGTD